MGDAKQEQLSPYLVWMDLEMTGLNPEVDSIIEIATIVSDTDLHIIAEGPVFVIHHPPSRFGQMDAWNQEHHTKSGLWSQVIASETSLQQAEDEILSFLTKFIGPKESPLCGNSIWQDRRFLAKYMPRVDAHLHYRMIDVSTIKEIGRRWYGEKARFTKEKGLHRALEDIRESIEEMRFYRKVLFVNQVNESHS